MTTTECGTVTAVPSFDPVLVTVDCTTDSSEVGVGEPVDISYTIENENEDPAETTVELVQNGNVLNSQAYLVFGGRTEEDTITISFDEPGDYQVTARVADVLQR